MFTESSMPENMDDDSSVAMATTLGLLFDDTRDRCDNSNRGGIAKRPLLEGIKAPEI
jgi:hypothetical protein